jgi:phage terminase large subunit
VDDTIDIELPTKLEPVFLGSADVRGAKGGRGSGKTRSFAKMAVVRAHIWAISGRSGIILCGRQFMNSLADSSMEEIKHAIAEEPYLAQHFDVGEKYIRTRCRRIHFVFSGLDRNIDSIKSKSRILLAWIDEAEAVSEVAWTKLIPTIREDGSELWVTWNPEKEDSPTHKRFWIGRSDRMKVVEMNWRDNPWFPARLDRERIDDLEHRPDSYDHIWEGDFARISDAQVLKGRCKVEEFEVDPKWSGPYYGADWGFSVDPSALVKCWIDGRRLLIEHEAYRYQVATDDLPAMFRSIEGSDKHVIRGDNSRPETINYLQRHGFPGCVAAEKWPGSVEDGIGHLHSYDVIIIHPRCSNTAKEARLWSYKTDRLTGDVLPVLLPGNDHAWDAIRYALAPLVKRRKASAVPLSL